MDGDQRLMLYWIEPGDVADCLAAKPELAEKFTYITRGRSLRHNQLNKPLVVPTWHLHFRRPSSLTQTVFHLFICCTWINHFPGNIAATIQFMVTICI